MAECPHCGCSLDAAKKPRSPEQLRRYFAMLQRVFANWPESHEKVFTDFNAFRAWLQMRAGYREEIEIMVSGMSTRIATAVADAAMRAAGSYAIAVAHKNKLFVLRPKSIAFRSMPQNEFNALNNAVAVVIEQETGMRIEDIGEDRAA